MPDRRAGIDGDPTRTRQTLAAQPYHRRLRVTGVGAGCRQPLPKRIWRFAKRVADPRRLIVTSDRGLRQAAPGCVASEEVALNGECRFRVRRNVNRLSGTAPRRARVVRRLQRHGAPTVGTGSNRHSWRIAPWIKIAIPPGPCSQRPARLSDSAGHSTRRVVAPMSRPPPTLSQWRRSC